MWWLCKSVNALAARSVCTAAVGSRTLGLKKLGTNSRLAPTATGMIKWNGLAAAGQQHSYSQGRSTCNLSYADMDFTQKLLEKKEAFIIDCDGVIYHGDRLLPGAKEFVKFLQDTGKKFLFLTNSSDKTAAKLVEKFGKLGLKTEESNFYTSAMSTATFLRRQKRGGRAYVVGQDCLRDELEKEGIDVVDEYGAEMSTPDFVVVGESADPSLYNFFHVEFAVKLVRRGARLIGTNEDVADRIGAEMLPGTGALILPIEAASGCHSYFVGKPNPLMVRSALDRLGVSRDKAVVVGDRMNTDIKAGVEAGVETILVLSGVTSAEEIAKFAYRPSTVLSGVGDIAAIIGQHAKRRGKNPPASSIGATPVFASASTQTSTSVTATKESTPNSKL